MIAGSIRILGFVLAACPLWAAVPEAVAEAARGAAFARDGKYELAIQHYKAALRLDSAVPGLQLNLGLAYFKSNHLREAAAAFEEAVAIPHAAAGVQNDLFAFLEAIEHLGLGPA